MIATYKTTDPRMQAVFLCLDIQERETLLKWRKTFKGNAQLQSVIEYLVEPEVRA